MENIDRGFIIISDIFSNFHTLYEKYKLKKQIKDIIYYKKFNNIYLNFVNKNMLNNLVNIKRKSIISKDYLKYYNTMIIKKNRINLMNELSITINKNNDKQINNKKRNISENNIPLISILDSKLTYKKRKYDIENNNDDDILLQNDSVKNKSKEYTGSDEIVVRKLFKAPIKNKSKEYNKNIDNITIQVDNLNNEYEDYNEEEYINELVDNYIISCCNCCSYINKIINHYYNKFCGFLKNIFS